MRATFHPAIFCLVLYVTFLAVVASSQAQLPERVATHFDGAGRPNGWETREGWRSASLFLGTALPLVALGAFCVLRWVPARMFNLPNRDHWLAPEQRGATLAYLMRHGWWLASIEIAFFIGIQWLIVQANATSPPQLANGPMLALAGVFLAALVYWIVQMRRRFTRVP